VESGTPPAGRVRAGTAKKPLEKKQTRESKKRESHRVTQRAPKELRPSRKGVPVECSPELHWKDLTGTREGGGQKIASAAMKEEEGVSSVSAAEDNEKT